MAFEGMDIDEVQALAWQLDANARALTGICGALGITVAEVGQLWLGPAWPLFQQEFETRHRPALWAAAQTLSDLQARLVANIDQQEWASAADGYLDGSGGGAGAGSSAGGWLSAADRGWRALTDADEAERVIEWPIDKIRALADAHEAGLPTGDGVWNDIQRLTADHTLPEIRDTKVVSWLHDAPAVKDADEFLADSHVYKVIDDFGPAGIVLGAISVVGDVKNAAVNEYDGNYADAGGDLVDAGYSALMSAKGVFWLGGFDLEELKADYDEITTGGPLPPLDWSNFKSVYLPSVTTWLPEEAAQAKGKLFDLLMGNG